MLLLLMLAGCSQFQPYIDRRREAGISDPSKLYIGLSKPNAPAVCYNSWVSSYTKVKKLADEECIKQKTGAHAEPVEQKIMSCKLFTPNHFVFKCVGIPPQDKEDNNQDEEYVNEENHDGFVN